MGTPEPPVITGTELTRIAWLSSQNRQQEFHSLMHHFNVKGLRHCYEQLDGKKAVGTDGIDKDRYGENLIGNLEDLVGRMKRMGYRPRAVRQVLISKDEQPGAKRPLGISNFEDKIVQKRMQQLLESIYDPIFLDSSFGFRPGRGCHDAIKALNQYLFHNEVETVIDVDLKNFFGTIDHELLTEILREKIKDTKLIRYIIRMFKAGILSDGELTVNDEGVQQGSCCSPILANIFAHHVIDKWFEETVKQHVTGPVEMFCYADDLVICCRHEQDAQRIKKALGNRLAKYKLQLNEDKSKRVRFSKRQYRRGERQETFDFLGFTFYLSKTRSGATVPKLKTSGKRFRSKLKKLSQWARSNRNKYTLEELCRRYSAKLRGHIQYYGMSFNARWLNKFLERATRIMFKWLNRRSQRKSFCWDKFKRYVEMHPLPRVRIHHRLF